MKRCFQVLDGLIFVMCTES
uniref:Uncharacterized protein n=1 Tax=Arundo donax TaxID=35708 RepID=A0A0A9BGC4_ARUDO